MMSRNPLPAQDPATHQDGARAPSAPSPVAGDDQAEQVGVVRLPLLVPRKPKVVVPPAAMVPLELAFLAVTVVPEVARVAFQLLVTFGTAEKPSLTVQPLTAVLPARTVTSAV